MANVPNVKLNNGYEIPVFGLGTYKSTGGNVETAVKAAIDSGYRHFDTAYYYQNEKEIGKAIRDKIAEKKITREDVFVTTKLWPTFLEADKVEHAFQLSSDNLNIDYIDLLLIHWPFGLQYIDDNTLLPQDANGKILINDVDFTETWKVMEELVRNGLVRSIGVSNFNSEQIGKVLSVATIKPVINQIEISPNLDQSRLIKFCHDRDIQVTAYSPLGRPNPVAKTPDFMFDEEVLQIGEKYGKSAAQVVLRYLLQLNVIVIPKSETKARIEQNIQVFDFKLNDVEMDVLRQFHNGKRIALLPQFSHAKNYPFNIEF